MPPVTEQEIAAIQPEFSRILVYLFIFGIVYAAAVRLGVKKGVEMNTAGLVVFGVAVTVLAFIPIFGLHLVFMLLAGFSASGFAMFVEYSARVHEARTKDKAEADELARRIVQSYDR
jgi:hypothetical protein